MIKKIFAGTMRRMFVWIVILCMIGILAIGIYSCATVSESLFEQIEKTSLYQMQIANERMNTLIKEIEFMTEEIENNKHLYINAPMQNYEQVNNMLASAVDSQIVGACYLITSNKAEFLYNPDGVYIDPLQFTMNYGSDTNAAGKLRWYNGSNKNNIRQYENHFIVCGNIAETDNSYTSVYFFIRKDAIEKILNIMHEKNNLVLMINDGKLLAVNDEARFHELVGSTMDILILFYETNVGLFNFERFNNEYITAHYQAPDSSFKFFTVYENDMFYEEAYGIIAFMIFFIIILLFLNIFLYCLMKEQFLHPLNKLIKHMDSDLNDEKFSIKGSLEIEMLVDKFNYMCKKINNGIAELKTNEKKKRQAEIVHKSSKNGQ